MELLSPAITFHRLLFTRAIDLKAAQMAYDLDSHPLWQLNKAVGVSTKAFKKLWGNKQAQKLENITLQLDLKSSGLHRRSKPQKATQLPIPAMSDFKVNPACHTQSPGIAMEQAGNLSVRRKSSVKQKGCRKQF